MAMARVVAAAAPPSRSNMSDVAPDPAPRQSRSKSSAAGGQSVGTMMREAKGLTLDLRAAIKRKEPWDREVEFQRESVRKAYSRVLFSSSVGTSSSMALLAASSSISLGGPSNALGSTASLASPSSSHSARLIEALNSLWLETSHSIINAYRARISAMDKAIAEAPQAHRRGGGRGGEQGGQPPPGPTARRKLVHSFRTFLAKEEEFFSTLLGRLAADLSPVDLDGLKTLGIVVERTEEVELPKTEDEKRKARSKAIPLVHKALICYGDLARYRELFNEHTGTQAKERGGRRGKDKAAATDDGERKPKNYARAAECYHQARILIPENGNPSNQLAVISGYSHDTLSSTYHYYRALSVRIPFPTARVNLELAYNKSVARWFDYSGPPRDLAEDFNAAFVALHGLYFTKQRISDISALSAKVQSLFEMVIMNLELSSDTIVKVVVTGLCALWDARVHRSSSNARKTPSKRAAEADADHSAPSTNVNLEPHILMHVLSIYRILLSVGANETAELYAANAGASSTPSEELHLAQNISSVVRRALPAMRVLFKWLMGQLEYITRVETRLRTKEAQMRRQHAADSATYSPAGATQESSSGSGAQRVELSADESMETDHINSASLEEELTSFWTAFADFTNALKLIFPIDDLPSAREGGVWLEEDVDLLGFAPLRRGMKEGIKAADVAAVEISRVGKDVHPNEEQLMRIAELQTIAGLLVESEICPLVVEMGALVSAPPKPSAATSVEDEPTPEELEAREVALATQRINSAFGTDVSPTKGLSNRVGSLALLEGEEGEGSEPTEDDPVDLAMRIAAADRMDMQDDTDEDDEDDDDEGHIVYRSRANLAAPHSAGSTSATITPPPGFSARPRPSTSQSSSNRNSVDLRSIWSPAPGESMHQQRQQQQQQQLPPPHQGSRDSFEALPNVTHIAASHAALALASAAPVGGPASIWLRPGESGHSSPALTRQGSLSATLGLAQQSPAPLPTNASLFGHFSPFTAPGSSSIPHGQPPLYPPSSTPASPSLGVHLYPHPPPGLGFGQQRTDLSASAFPFVSHQSPQSSPQNMYGAYQGQNYPYRAGGAGT